MAKGGPVRVHACVCVCLYIHQVCVWMACAIVSCSHSQQVQPRCCGPDRPSESWAAAAADIGAKASPIGPSERQLEKGPNTQGDRTEARTQGCRRYDDIMLMEVIIVMMAGTTMKADTYWSLKHSEQRRWQHRNVHMKPAGAIGSLAMQSMLMLIPTHH